MPAWRREFYSEVSDELRLLEESAAGAAKKQPDVQLSRGFASAKISDR
jgi:hypothetical protein